MKKLYRSRRDSKLFGLCGGLAEMLNVDSTLLRIVVLVTAFFSGGAVIPLYFIACLVIPKEPAFDPFTPPFYANSSRPDYPPYSPYNGQHASSYYGPHQAPQPKPHYGPNPSVSQIDEMMHELEKKALRKEIEELRAKLARYEKGGKA